MNETLPQSPEAVAIIGMAGRFPRARNLDEFWRNLRAGTECVSFFKDDEVEWLPIEHAPALTDPRYVKARAMLEKPEWFDAAFFGLNPREAAIMDPQHRVFLECAWEALEDAGCDPEACDGLIGVFAGASMNTYLFTNLLSNPELVKNYGLFSSMIMNDGDFVPTRVSYKLNLRGPSINVQTACSTSLVAVCLACQNLLSYRCDVALAGGVSITFPSRRGQHHLEGGILSHDGHCRAFDAQATGTVLGDGAGIVVLKRLSEALADGDRICAVIKGTAINNDGAVKIGYTAPSADGQAECIAMAQAEAGVAPETISYVEAHGTGTPLGDPIEIAGLTKAFDLPAGTKKICSVGSVKSNIGHLDIAAGVAGLIKTVLSLQHGEIPPSVHFETPNPKLELDRTPFFINGALRPWPRRDVPRRAGVSSFGIGGTNAHAVLEEAPSTMPAAPSNRPQQLLVISAKTPTALGDATENLAAHLRAHPEQQLADVAFSLQTRRKAFGHRRIVVADTAEAAVAALAARDSQRVVTGVSDGSARPVVFMFPGQGAQAINMGRELYEVDPGFRADVDRCSEILQPRLGSDLRRVLFPAADKQAETTELLTQTRITQPALFVIEYALAQLWIRRGVRPQAMIGHSLGEYVAACVAGVFSLEDSLALVAERARLMQAQPAGAMLAVRLSEDRVAPFLNETLSLAATNTRGLCVVSGPFDAIMALEKKLGEGDVASRRLATSHAFHSAMMEPALQPLADFVSRLPRHAPKIPFVSNVTGTWITAEQACDPRYWATHLRRTVRFADGIATIAAGGKLVLLEVGPGQTLAGLARQNPAVVADTALVVASLGHGKEVASEYAALLQATGLLWSVGVEIDWKSLHAGETRRFVSLPTYPFERKRYWIEPGVDFRALLNQPPSAIMPAAAPVDASSNGQHANDSSSSKIEETIHSEPATLLAELKRLFGELSGLDLANASAEATFYQLGFDSLFLTQASLAVTKRFGVDVTFRQLREQWPTLAKLSAHLESQRITAPVSPATAATVSLNVPADDTTRTSPIADKLVPLTDAQREMWFASQLGREVSSAYNESSNIHLDGALDVAALQRAFVVLIQRHEALRTTFEPAGDQQRVAAMSPAQLAVRDFTSVADAAREERVQAFIRAELERPFDLVKGPLFRAHLLRLSPERHVLVLVVHHIICDGWSLGILQQELGALYAIETKQSTKPLAPAPRFSDYAAEQVARRDTPEWSAAEAFWKKQFADSVPVLDLPADRPRPVERTYAGAFMLRVLSPDVTTGLKRLCAERDCTIFTALLAAFNVLLHRLSGQDDLVVGIPAAAQVMDGLDHLIGHFANLLPVRSRVADGQTFATYLDTMRGQLAEALEHWRYPFGLMLQGLNLPRDASRMPLANVVFNSTRLRGTVPFGDLMGVVQGNAKRFSHFDLNLNFAATGDTISLGAYYSTELFDEATVARWFGHFETLLRGILAQPATHVTELPLLSAVEREQMLVEWNSARLDYERDAVIADLFEAQVRRTPDAIAIVTPTERVTYRQLDEQAERLAVQLRKRGVGPDVLVGIFLERTPQLLVAIFGILKAGGAYVPLDPTYPADRLEFIVNDTQMPIVVTQRSLVAQLPAGGFHFLSIDDDARGHPRLNGAITTAAARPVATSLAYIIYTSGSTGRPKGVAIVQRCVVALAAWARSVYQPAELDGVLFSTSASFDISIFEIFVPLCLGGKIILADNLLQVDGLPTAGEIRFLSGVPSAVAELVRLRKVPRSVTTVALAGEVFPQPLVDALYALPHIERVFELYGPTEVTVYSTGSLRKPNTHPTLGRPFPNEQIYVLDRNLQPVPIGVTGEIFIGGDKLARGYLNRPELTAEKFIVSPFIPGERLYRSGDLGKWCADGTIESSGRVDHQVKVRGFRVELGEIESTLTAHSTVAEAAVIARSDSAGHNRLLAYVVPRNGGAPEPRELRAHVQATLPEYMVPTAIVVLPKLPLTANGKLDRRALPDPETARADSDYVAPGTTTEELLAEIWRGVLDVKRVSIHDNFFELGGHSLLATQVIARVHDTLEVELSMRQFFAAPTVAGLATVIEATLIQEIKTMADGDAGSLTDESLAAAKE
jgi:amino acid adenylation domain-containing protein